MAVTTESSEFNSPSPSPSSGTNFRELDDAFLQSQTRIWLGEVLQIRFDEETNIGDLLADGELLLEVSEVLSRTFPTLGVDATQMKVNEGKSAATNKSTRRYMPYYNVGSFLRMCKKLGLDGIDLFDPSDVVDKRNTRKVCMCIRSLSKKVMSRELNVTAPDFDSVTCTLSMPTDMVQCIRKSLELSQSSASPSAGPDSGKVSRVRYWRRMSDSTSAQSNGDSSDNCDEAESCFVVPESNGPSDYVYDAACSSNPDSQMVRDNCSENLKLHLNTEDRENEEDEQCEYLSPSIAESVGSFCSQYYSDQELSSMPSSPGLGSCVNGKVLEVETEHGYQNGDVTHVPIDWEHSSLNGSNHIDGNAKNGVAANVSHENANNGETDNVSHDKEDVDSTCFDGGYPTKESKSCNAHIENSAYHSEIECEKSSSDDIQMSECVVEDDFCAGKSPDLSLEEEQLDNNAAKHEMANNDLSPEIGVSSSDGKFKDGDISNELLIQSPYHVSSHTKTPYCSSYGDANQKSQIFTEVNTGGNFCCDSLNSANTTEDLSGQVVPLAQQFSCSVGSEAHSYNSSSLDPRAVAQSSASAPLIHDRGNSTFTDIQNDKQALDANMIASNLSGHPDNHCVGDNPNDFIDKPGTGFNSSAYIVGAEASKSCSDDSQDTREVSADNNDHAEIINGKHTNTEAASFCPKDDFMGGDGLDSLDMPDKKLNSSPSITKTKDCINGLDDSQDTLKVSGAYNVTAESTTGKPIDVENGTAMDSSATILSASLPGAENPESIEDAAHKLHQRAENLVKGEKEHNNTNKETSQSQPRRKLIKSVVKGTALVGIAVVLIHLRKYAKINLPRAKKQPVETLISNRSKSSRQMGQKVSSTSSVYPAEKLKLGI